MERPWSTIFDDELKLLRQLVEKAKDLRRGCNCDYDYRCGNCQRIIDCYELAEQAEKAR